MVTILKSIFKIVLTLSLPNFNYINHGFAPTTKCKYQVMEPGLSLQNLLVSRNPGVI